MSSRTDPPLPPPTDDRKHPRFPFAGHPTGWFVVALSRDLEPGKILHLHYFGRDLVAYRGASGRAYVTDAYCPHLGAHLGHGGKIEGETIRCPFHGWRFEGDGPCVEIPYSDKIPPKARLDAFPVREQNGAIHVFHDPAGGEPWDLPALEEEGWTEGQVIHCKALKTHVQEVFENTVDPAHIGPIHAGREARCTPKPHVDGTTMTVDVEFLAPGDIVGMPEQLNDVHLHVTLRGLGDVVVHTHVRNVDVRARQRIYATPVSADTIDIRGIVHVKKTDDPRFTEELADIFYRAYVEDFAKDFPIWEHKRYLTRPLLSKGDGPIVPYRRWCEQFYVSESSHPAHDSTTSTTTPVPPDVPLSALRKNKLPSLLSPLQQRVTDTAHLLLAAARKHLPWTDRLSPTRNGTDGTPPDPQSTEHPTTPTGTIDSTPQPTSTIFVTSAEEYFETLPKRFVPSAAAGVDAIFQWELAGEGGGTFHAHVHDGRLDLRRGPHDRPTVALCLPATDYVRVVNGELDGVRAFTTGGGKVKGSIAAAMKMRTLFPARSPSA